jgi:hypothetical protein
MTAAPSIPRASPAIVVAVRGEGDQWSFSPVPGDGRAARVVVVATSTQDPFGSLWRDLRQSRSELDMAEVPS